MEAVTLTKPLEEPSESLYVHEAVTAGSAKPTQNEIASKNNNQEKKDVDSEITDSQLEDIAAKMNQVSTVFNTSLAFTVDKPTGKSIIKVMDVETEKIIRQIPPDNMLKLMSRMRDVMGMLLDVEI